MEPVPLTREQGARSRAAILRAATELFAEQGYGATTLQQVGRRAGLSRGTPGYFFGAKERLYRAVLDQAFAQARNALLAARAQADREGLTGEAAFAHALEAYIDFLVEHPEFVRLVEWEALEHGARLEGAASHLELVLSALEEIGAALREQLPAGFDVPQLLLSVAGLCWFPVAHRETLGKVMAVDTLDPEFVAARKRHVKDLVLNGMRGSGRREESRK